MAMIKCNECGNEYSDRADKCPSCGCPNAKIVKPVWGVGKLCIGIISIILFAIISFQSCAATAAGALGNDSDTAGDGMIGGAVAWCMLISGIVGIATRKSPKTGPIVSGVFYMIAWLMTVCASGSYGDLSIWGGVSFAFGCVYILSAIIFNVKQKKAKKEAE